MFLGAAFTTKTGMSGVWNELGDLLPAWAYSLLWAVVFAAIGLLVASLTGKRAFAAGGIVAVFLMTTPVVGVLSSLPSRTAQELAGLASPMTLVTGIGSWLIPSTNGGLIVGPVRPGVRHRSGHPHRRLPAAAAGPLPEGGLAVTHRGA